MSRLSIDMIRQAAARINGHAYSTPLVHNRELNQAVGAEVFIKAECLQRTGSFKFRGALNRLLMLTAEELHRGVIGWSSGNHAQGLAAAASVVNTHATIVMPHDTPQIKITRTRRAGAEIIFYDRVHESREEIGHALAARTGAIIVPPYDDYDVMAGQGTCALELHDQCAKNGITLDALLVPCGGGGLSAGVSTAMKSLSPATEIYAVEPTACNDHQRSLLKGDRVTNDPDATSFCDALLAPTPGALTFPINAQNLTGVLTATDSEVRAAIRFAALELKLVVEPGGCIALAALLAHKLETKKQRIGVIISGGNIDPAQLSTILRDSN